MSGELPEGWVWVRVSEVTEALSNATPEDYPEREFGYVDISSIDNATFTISELKRFRGEDAPSRARRPIRADDVLFSNVRTYLRNVALVPNGLKADLCSTGFTVLRSNPAVLPRFLFRYVLSDDFIDRVTPQQTGTHYPATSDRVVVGERIPLPPVAEQHRIVAKLEQLLGKVDTCQQRLAKVPVLLKRFRLSVLAAACSGRLTADWREENECAEDAAALLDRMKVERRQRCLAEKRNRKYRDSDAVLDRDLPEVPETWRWTNFDHCSWEITVGHVGPMKDRYVEKGVTFLRCQNVRPLKFDSNGLVCIPSDFHAQLSKSQLVGGEILVVRSGANTGDCCVFPTGLGEANCSDLVITRPLSGLAAQYGALYVNSPIGQALLSLNETGIAQPHFNIGAMRVKAFPLPPLAEQHEIVRRVEGLFALADQIDDRLGKAETQINKLTQSLLARAFGGALVPTEAQLARQEGRDYEPASALLERVQRERMRDEGEVKRPTHPKASTAARNTKRTARAGRRASLSR